MAAVASASQHCGGPGKAAAAAAPAAAEPRLLHPNDRAFSEASTEVGAISDRGSSQGGSSPRSGSGSATVPAAQPQPECSKPRWCDISEADGAPDLELEDDFDLSPSGGFECSPSPTKSSKRSARRRRRREEASKYAACEADSMGLGQQPAAAGAAGVSISQGRGVVLLGDIGLDLCPDGALASGTVASASPTARGALSLPTTAVAARPRPPQVCPSSPAAAHCGPLGIMSTSPRADIVAASCDASARTPVRTPGGPARFSHMAGPMSPTADASARTPLAAQMASPQMASPQMASPMSPLAYGNSNPCSPAAGIRPSGDASMRTPVAAGQPSPMRSLWPQAFDQRYPQMQPQMQPAMGATQPQPQYHSAVAGLASMTPPPQREPFNAGTLVYGSGPLPTGEDLAAQLRAAAPEAYED